MGTKDIVGKKIPREPIRPDDDNILEKLRVKRTVSIPSVNLPASAPFMDKEEIVTPTPSQVPASIIPENSHEPQRHKEDENSLIGPSSLPFPPKLVVNGRLPRKKGSSSRSLQLMHSIEEDIKKYCSGGDLVLINYLIKLGLEQVKKSEDTIFVNASDI